ncbi:MAG: alanine--tRNA ligase [Nitrospirae bacterium]|jgi:alanyl-tRNA synthetase|nr:alanine--tRNA ligase [Nitrospirota bacterium]
MKSSEIRTAFLEYFQSKGHKIVPSSPLIPWDDPTLIFVNAGMVQFKKIFLGNEKADFTRATTCQKCMRAGGKHSDLENVGHTARHHTFFEMLGNFSFGDYFKKDAIIFGWDLLTNIFGLPEDKLYVSVFEEDDEAAKLWNELTGIPEYRIVRLGAKDNFWQMGDTGPCGPCSEIIIDQGSDIGCGNPDCSVACDCDRFLELWNLVFMQYNRDESGQLNPLPKPSIDTGMGLERISAVLQGKYTNFDTDIFKPIIDEISSLSGIEYGSSSDSTVSMRVIADHIRASVFILSEGCVPSNEGRGYVLRRIIRRASRHAKLLNLHEPCLYKLTASVIESMGNVYPEIIKENSRNEKFLKIEEENFHRTIENSMNLFDEIIKKAKSSNLKVIPGEEVARLQQTHGLPLDFAKDIALDAGLIIDEEGFHKEMEAHRQKSKITSSSLKDTTTSVSTEIHRIGENTIFVGYDSLTSESSVLAILIDNEAKEELNEGEEGILILDRTPFYGESGGQVGDIGFIETVNSLIEITDTKKPSQLFYHYAKVLKGKIKKGEKVLCRVNDSFRKAVMRNHTATHLLHKSLRMVLGNHVKQSGSVVDNERLRFDFTHFSGMSKNEIENVEDIVNEKIIENLPVKTDIMNIQDAMNSGAMALFDEKYGDTVRVVSAGDFSKELCGGTHCKSTGEIGLFVITSEGSVASGVRRIEALTGKSAFNYIRQQRTELSNIKEILKGDKPSEKIQKLLADIKSLEKEVQKLKTGSSRDIINDAINSAITFDNAKIISLRQDNMNLNELRLLSDNIRDRLKSGIIVTVSVSEGQASIVCMVTKDLTNKFHAGNIMKKLSAIAGGKGGGKPELAQGGTKDIEKLETALRNLKNIIEDTISP